MYVYGKNVIEEVLKKNKKIYKAYLSYQFADQMIETTLQKRKITIKYVEKRKLDELVSGRHQGIILDIEEPTYTDLETFYETDHLLVILDHLQDPHNFGAIIRSCEATGVDGIIIPKNRSVDINSTVMSVSVGALENVPICKVVNLNQTVDKLKQHGYWIIGTDMHGTPYREIDYKGKIALVIGSEGKGMSRLTSESCDVIATIPMRGTINSLNASVATSVILFEASNQRF